MSKLVCHTQGCENHGIAIDYQMTAVDEETGDTVTVTAAICGACGQPITDITGT